MFSKKAYDGNVDDDEDDDDDDDNDDDNDDDSQDWNQSSTLRTLRLRSPSSVSPTINRRVEGDTHWIVCVERHPKSPQAWEEFCLYLSKNKKFFPLAIKEFCRVKGGGGGKAET